MAIGGDERVRRLEIAVDNPQTMRVGDRVCHRDHECNTRIVTVLSVAPLRKRAPTSHVLHRNPRTADAAKLGLASLIEPCDRWMLQTRQRIGFPHEPRKSARPRVGPQNFEGNIATRRFLMRPIDLSCGTAA